MAAAGVRHRREWIAAAALVLFAASAAVLRVVARGADAAGHRASSAPAIPVAAVRAQQGELALYLDALGTVTPLNTVTVRTQVDGQLAAVHFEEGQLVRAHDLLAQIDPRPFQVQLEQAEGQAARDAATLANARIDLARYQALIAQDAIPRQQLDTQLTTVRQLEATLESDKAQIEAARLNLAYARITSPITGRIGLRLLDPGNIVHTTDADGLAVITQRQPIAVVFTIPEDRLREVQQQLTAGRLEVDAYDRTFETKLASGTLSAIDTQIDPATGTVKLKATFANGRDELFPNQFVNARLRLRDVSGVVVPSAAIRRGEREPFVYVVASNHRVDSRPIAEELTSDDRTVVSSGLSAGELVVTSGFERLQPGVLVAPQSDGEAPASQEAP